MHVQDSYEAAAASTTNAAILQELAGYLMPKDNPEYRWRIGTALTFLIASKGLNVAVRTQPPPKVYCQLLVAYCCFSVPAQDVTSSAIAAHPNVAHEDAKHV
jgi:hypothetical protein